VKALVTCELWLQKNMIGCLRMQLILSPNEKQIHTEKRPEVSEGGTAPLLCSPVLPLAALMRTDLDLQRHSESSNVCTTITQGCTHSRGVSDWLHGPTDLLSVINRWLCPYSILALSLPGVYAGLDVWTGCRHLVFGRKRTG
jgi:hypothetical protein